MELSIVLTANPLFISSGGKSTSVGIQQLSFIDSRRDHKELIARRRRLKGGVLTLIILAFHPPPSPIKKPRICKGANFHDVKKRYNIFMTKRIFSQSWKKFCRIHLPPLGKFLWMPINTCVGY